MDSYIRTNSGAPLITPWSPRGMSEGKYAAVTAAREKKDAIQSAAYKAFDTPTFKAAESNKHKIEERIQGIVKRLKILKKLFGGNPKEMARALTQVFKELRAAVKEYKAETEKEIGGSKAAVTSSLPPEANMTSAPTVPATAEEPKAEDTEETPEATDEVTDEAATEVEAAPAEAEPTLATTDATEQKPAEDKTANYGAIDQKVRELAGEDGMRFLKELKGILAFIEERMLNPVRIQHKAQKPDKDTDKAFEDVEKELKELKKDMEDMTRDLKHEVPTLGMHLDVAA